MRKSLWVVGLSVSWCAWSATGAAAQDVQVPIDEDGKVQVITADLERKLKLFPDYPAFREARLFQLPDSSFVLEITQEPGGRLIRVRVPMDQTAVQDLRRRISAGLRETSPEAILDQSGRTKLLVWTTVLSLGFYGPAAPVVLDVNDPQGAVGLYMVAAGAGFILPFLATRHVPVTEAGAVLGTYGATRGILHGILATQMFDHDPTGRAVMGAGLVGGLVEGIVGFSVANGGRMTGGTAELVGIGADAGLGIGLGAAHVAGLFDEDPLFCCRTYTAAVSSGLLSMAAGAGVGYALSRTEPYTRGDAFLLRNAGILGAHIGLAVADAANPDGTRDKLYSALAVTGGTLGLIAGQRLVHGRDFTTAQGTFGTLGQIAGGLVGLGLGYLVSPRDGDQSTMLLAGSALGAGAGYALMYAGFARQAKVSVLPEGLDVLVDPLASALRLSYRF
jgi:hypothetical protein